MNFKLVMKHLNLTPMPHILPALAIETISKETGDYYPVFYNAFARSTLSAETL